MKFSDRFEVHPGVLVAQLQRVGSLSKEFEWVESKNQVLVQVLLVADHCYIRSRLG